MFTGEISSENVIIGDGIILGVSDYTDTDADIVKDISGCTVCPGLIDGHIHIESTMLAPAEFVSLTKNCFILKKNDNKNISL